MSTSQGATSSSQLVPGVEPSSANGSLMMVSSEQKLVWTIDEINRYLRNSVNDIVSPVFHLGKGENCSMYLKLSQGFQDPFEVIGFYVNFVTDNRQKIMADCNVYIICKNGKQRQLLSGVNVFDYQDWGSSACVLKKTLLDDAKGYVKDDKLIVYCNVEFARDMNHVRSSISENYPLFSKNFELLFKDEAFSDLTLVASGESFQVHRNILACRSAKFYKMHIREALEEKEETVVKFDDISPKIMEEMLRFIYCGKVNNFNEISSELLSASTKYCIPGLQRLCEAELIRSLRLDNAVDYLVLAGRHELLSLKKHAMEFIIENPVAVTNTQGFKKWCKSGDSALLGEAFSKLAETQETKRRRLS